MELKRDKAGAQPAGRGALAMMLFGLLLVSWIGEWPLEQDQVMYSGMWRSPLVFFAPLFAPLPGISLFPWQLLLVALVPFCFAGKRHAPEMDRAIFISIACIGVTFMWGLLRGGAPYFAYYQVWRFMTALLIAYVFMSVVRNERELVTLGKMVVIAAVIRAILCIYFFWTYLQGKVDPLPQYVTNHDDSMLFAAATFVVGIWAFLKGGGKTWIFTLLILALLFYAMVLNDRRIVWVEIAMALPLIYLMMGPGPQRTLINRWALRLSPIVLVYFVAGMFSHAAIFAPVQSLMSTGSDYDPSSLTRQEEARNLLHTLVESGNPLFGTGWGRPYDKVESYWSNYSANWVLVLYTPHNSLLGLAAFSGLVGIVGIWGVLPIGAFLATRGYRKSTELVPRTAALVAVGVIVAYSVHSYGDVGLQSFPGCVLFGAALGTAGKIAVWSHTEPALRTALARTGTLRGRGRRAVQDPALPAEVETRSAGAPTRRLSRQRL
jgi:hypothetical protein